MKALLAILLSSTALLAQASTVYEYVGTPDTCGWPVAASCPGTIHATLTLRDDGTPERVDYGWRGYRDWDEYLFLTIQRRSLPAPSWTENVLSDYEGVWDVFVRQRYFSMGGGGTPYDYVNMGYNSPDNWFASSGDYTGQYISVTSVSSYMALDAYWFARGRLTRVPEPPPLLLAVPLLGLLWGLWRKTMRGHG